MARTRAASFDSADLSRWRPLVERLRGEVSIEQSMRGAYATDASVYQQFPQAVVFPQDCDDVAAIVAFCHEHGISMVGRGAGTSLSGQAIGPGLIVDFSRHMNRILSIDADARLAVVQPGVVLDVLNQALAPHRLLFAPDPATASRATIGGMIGNNACGTRSIVFGRTCDAIESLNGLLADGTELIARWMNEQEWLAAAQTSTRLGSIYRALQELLSQYANAIIRHIPQLPRIAAGYSVRRLVDPAGPRSLSELIVGGEGTLILATEATLRLRSVPSATRLVISAFASIAQALEVLPFVLKHGPSAVELLDDVLIQEAVRNAATREYIGAIVPSGAERVPTAVLMVEFFGDTEEDADARANHYTSEISKTIANSRNHILVRAQEQRAAWEVRRLGLGLISNLPGKRKSIALIEDACLPIDKLPEYHRIVSEWGERLDLGVSTYGHASVGVLHYKVMLDLHEADERRKMREMAEACFDACCRLGGVFSGEHGDGIVRAEFLNRQFGPDIYELFVAIKRLFDPRGLLNPGRKIDAPPMDSHLRYGDRDEDRQRYQAAMAQVASLYRYTDQGGLIGAVEQCNGVGACRQVLKGTMCPSYRATSDERDSTRGRANLLRLAISGQLDPPGLGNPELHQALDLCLACKACKSECPNAVDMARLKSEALAARWREKRPTPQAYFIGRMPQRLRRWQRLARLANWGSGVSWTRWLLERRFGIDRRRALPHLAPRSFDDWWRSKRRRRDTQQSSTDVVALFVDAWHRYLEPHIPIAAVNVLESLGLRVEVPRSFDGLRSRLSVGLLEEAQRLADPLYRELASFVDRGWPIVCIEPSEASALMDDLPDLVRDEGTARRVAARTYLIDDYLAQQIRRESVKVAPVPEFARRPVIIHPHCHQRALFSAAATADVLSAAGYQVSISDWGCCGMAGSFGYTHFDLSQQIARQRFVPGLESAQASTALVVAIGTSCRQQARDLVAIEIGHWLELLAH